MFLLDMKPDQAVTEQKYILRAGHGGNLDAMATGVLGKSYLAYVLSHICYYCWFGGIY